jgi:glycerophosphoryl diester phosphodiesterase
MWPRPLLFGHRGAPGDGCAENTIASFERALLEGATALETDAHMTLDGHVVLSHDESLGRVFGKDVVIAKTTLADVQAVAPVPTLATLLARFVDVPINIDIKQRAPRMDEAIVRAVRDANATSRVLLTSFHADVVRAVRRRGYEGPTGMGRDEVARLLFVPRALIRAWPLSGKRVQVPRREGRLRFDTKEFVDKAHALGVAVDYWTINDVDEARELLALGADGIMSDVPGVVAEAFRSPTA